MRFVLNYVNTDEKQRNRQVTHSEPGKVQARRQTARTLGLRGRGGRAYACVSRDGVPRYREKSAHIRAAARNRAADKTHEV